MVYVKRVISTTIEDVARVLGVSVRGVRLRVDALAGVDSLLAGQVRKAAHGRLEYSVAVLEMLKDPDMLAESPKQWAGR